MFGAYLNDYYTHSRISKEDIKRTAHCLSAAPMSNVNGYLVQCPAHDDKVASLSISPGDRTAMVMYCHAGCSYEEIKRGILKTGGVPDKVLSFLTRSGTSRLKKKTVMNEVFSSASRRRAIPQDQARVSYSLFKPTEGESGEKCIIPQKSEESLEAFMSRHRHFTCVESKEKQSVPRISGSTYKPGATRGRAGIDYVTILILDFDHSSEPMKRAVQRERIFGRALTEYLGFGHTTISNTKGSFYYRLFLPLKEWIPIEGWPASVTRLRRDLERMECLDQAAWKDPAKMYISPCFRKENIADIGFVEFKGNVPLSVSH